MNISITKKDAAATAAAFRKAGIKAITYAQIGNCFLDYRTAQMLNNTLKSFESDNYSIEMDGNKVIICHGSFKGSFYTDEEAKGTEIFLNHKIFNQMDINTIFTGLQAARQNGMMKAFVKETKENFNIDLSVQGIRSAGHHEGQVYRKLEAFERYAAGTPKVTTAPKVTPPKMETAPKVETPKATPTATSKVTDPAPTAAQIELRAEKAQNALLELVNNLNMLNEDKVIELINTHRPKIDNAEIKEMLIDIVKDIPMAPTTKIYIAGTPEKVTTIEGITHPKFEQILTLLHCGLNPFITGPAGSGKTFTAQQCAKALNLPFYALSLSAQTTQSQIFGYMNANGNFVETDFYKAFVNGGVFCFDEIDNGNPNVLAAINSALSNGICSFANGMQEKHPDFKVVATANTIGNGATAQYVGRNAIDKATLDRFQVVYYEYDAALELIMCNNNRDIYNMVVNARELLKETKAVISPRATAAIHKLTTAGMDIKTAFELTVTNKLTDNEKAILCK